MDSLTLFPVNEAVLQDHFSDTGVTDTEMDMYELLLERTPEMNISHKIIPSLEEHCRFVRSLPYSYWYLIQMKEEGRPIVNVGTIYLTDRREVGLFIFKKHKRKGYGTRAMLMLKEMHPGDFYFNINPSNHKSIKFFEEMGAKHIQNTYALEEK